MVVDNSSLVDRRAVLKVLGAAGVARTSANVVAGKPDSEEIIHREQKFAELSLELRDDMLSFDRVSAGFEWPQYYMSSGIVAVTEKHPVPHFNQADTIVAAHDGFSYHHSKISKKFAHLPISDSPKGPATVLSNAEAPTIIIRPENNYIIADVGQKRIEVPSATQKYMDIKADFRINGEGYTKKVHLTLTNHGKTQIVSHPTQTIIPDTKESSPLIDYLMDPPSNGPVPEEAEVKVTEYSDLGVVGVKVVGGGS